MPTGEVEIRGPMTEEEKVVWDRIEESEAAIAELEGMLAKSDNPDNEFIEEELAFGVASDSSLRAPSLTIDPGRHGGRRAKKRG